MRIFIPNCQFWCSVCAACRHAQFAAAWDGWESILFISTDRQQDLSGLGLVHLRSLQQVSFYCC